MNLELEAYEGELRELRKLKSLIKHDILADKLGNIYFIAGQSGNLDDNGLPDKIHICPAYGVDWIHIYQKTDQTFGPEW